MADHPTYQELADIIEHSAQANAALMRGDIKRYRDLITLTDDFTLMSPFGGTPTYATEYTPERIEAMGRFFRNGTPSNRISFRRTAPLTW
jgi:hypothetical protein